MRWGKKKGTNGPFKGIKGYEGHPLALKIKVIMSKVVFSGLLIETRWCIWFSRQNIWLKRARALGRTPSTAGTFRKKFRKNSGKTPETLSEHFQEFPSRVRLGSPKPYNLRRLRLPEHFQNSLPPSTAGDASFFRSASGEGLSEPAMEFPAVLVVYPRLGTPKKKTSQDLYTTAPLFRAATLQKCGSENFLRFFSAEGVVNREGGY